MSEVSNRIQRCQRCGCPLATHPQECYPVARGAFDMSHNNLAEIDRLSGELLAEMMKLRSIEVLQNSYYGQEFFALLDARRQG